MINLQTLRNWLPFAFCAFLVYIQQRNQDRITASQSILIWMPMCFFYVGAVTYLMQKQIADLKAELQDLKKRVAKPNHEA